MKLGDCKGKTTPRDMSETLLSPLREIRTKISHFRVTWSFVFIGGRAAGFRNTPVPLAPDG